MGVYLILKKHIKVLYWIISEIYRPEVLAHSICHNNQNSCVP